MEQPGAPGGPVVKDPGGYPLREINPGPRWRRCEGRLQVWSFTPQGGNPRPQGMCRPVGNGARAAPGRGIPGPGGDPLPSPSCRPDGIAALFVYGFEHFRFFGLVAAGGSVGRFNTIRKGLRSELV